MHDGRRAVTAVLCLVLLPFSLVAEDAKAILTPTGNVSVNGKPISRATPLFEGDKIKTGADASASIASQGSSINLGADSSLTYSSRNVSFGCGSAVIASSGTPTSTTISGIEVSFGTQPARVQFSDSGGVLLVKVLYGSAQVKEAGAASSLAEGFSVARPGSAACNAAASAADKSAPSVKPHSNTTLILGILAAGGAAGAALGAAGGKKSGATTTPTPTPTPSPSVP